MAFVGMTVKLWMLQLSPKQHSILQSSKVMFCNARVVLNSEQKASLSKEKKFIMKCVYGSCFFEPFFLIYLRPSKLKEANKIVIKKFENCFVTFFS